MRHRAAVLLAVVVATFALAAAGCDRSASRHGLARFAPADSLAVLSVDWARVRGDADLREIVSAAEMERLLEGFSVPAAEVSEVAAFGDGRGAGGRAGLVVRGSYKAQAVIDALKARGWTARESGGAKIYGDPRGENFLARVDGGVLAAGTRAAVEGALRAADDEGESFVSNASYRKLAPRFRADGKRPAVSLVVAFPQSAQDVAEAATQIASTVLDLGGVGPLGELLGKIGYARALGCSVSRDGAEFPVRVVAVMKDEQSAALVSGTLNIFQGVASFAETQRNLPRADAEAPRGLRDLEITRERDVLSVKASLGRADLTPPARR